MGLNSLERQAQEQEASMIGSLHLHHTKAVRDSKKSPRQRLQLVGSASC
jgi:hypothetical protein